MAETSTTEKEQMKPPEYSVEGTIQSVHDIGDGIFSINPPRDGRPSDERAPYEQKLAVPPNITLMPLPPKAPERNPVENLCQFIRDIWLSDRICQSGDDILDHACAGWNRIVDQPWRIMTIGMRDWAAGF